MNPLPHQDHLLHQLTDCSCNRLWSTSTIAPPWTPSPLLQLALEKSPLRKPHFQLAAPGHHSTGLNTFSQDLLQSPLFLDVQVNHQVRCKQFQNEILDCKNIFDITLALRQLHNLLRVSKMKVIFSILMFWTQASKLNVKAFFNPIWLHTAYFLLSSK